MFGLTSILSLYPSKGPVVAILFSSLSWGWLMLSLLKIRLPSSMIWSSMHPKNLGGSGRGRQSLRYLPAHPHSSFRCRHLPQVEGQGSGVMVVYRNNKILTVKPAREHLGMQFLHLLLGACDRVGLLLVYWHASCPTLSLLGLADVVFKVGLGSWDLLCRGTSTFMPRPWMISWPRISWLLWKQTLGLSQLIPGPTHHGGHAFDLVFCAGWDDLKREDIVVVRRDHHHHASCGLLGIPGHCNQTG